MPIYDYQCRDCGQTYDVFHKHKEVLEDVLCPSCGSQSHRKLMSVTQISMGKDTTPGCGDGSCGSFEGGCASGMCGLN